MHTRPSIGLLLALAALAPGMRSWAGPAADTAAPVPPTAAPNCPSNCPPNCSSGCPSGCICSPHPISNGFSFVAKKTLPAVVFLKVKIAPQAPEYGEGYGDPFNFGDSLFHRFFGFPDDRERAPEFARGSGFFVSADGYILTNAHVVKGAESITAVLNDGRELEAVLIGADSHTDIALIKVEGSHYPFLALGDSDAMEIGDWVIAIGSPFQLDASLTAGVISATGRQNLNIADLENFIQTDAAINPGNSGGPLCNLSGAVIGINTAIATRSGGFAGIGFAIPSNIAKNIMKQLLDSGVVARGYLGVTLQPMTADMAKSFHLDKAEGALVSEVLENSPAAKAGLKQGDVIVGYNDTPLTSLGSFRLDISLSAPGTVVQLKVNRQGTLLDIPVTLAEASDIVAASIGSLAQKLGIEVENLTPTLSKHFGYDPSEKGVVVTRVRPGSPAARVGLQPGHLIIAADHKKVESVEDFQAIAKELGGKDQILILARYHRMNRFYLIKFD